MNNSSPDTHCSDSLKFEYRDLFSLCGSVMEKSSKIFNAEERPNQGRECNVHLIFDIWAEFYNSGRTPLVLSCGCGVCFYFERCADYQSVPILCMFCHKDALWHIYTWPSSCCFLCAPKVHVCECVHVHVDMCVCVCVCVCVCDTYGCKCMVRVCVMPHRTCVVQEVGHTGKV